MACCVTNIVISKTVSSFLCSCVMLLSWTRYQLCLKSIAFSRSVYTSTIGLNTVLLWFVEGSQKIYMLALIWYASEFICFWKMLFKYFQKEQKKLLVSHKFIPKTAAVSSLQGAYFKGTLLHLLCLHHFTLLYSLLFSERCKFLSTNLSWYVIYLFH